MKHITDIKQDNKKAILRLLYKKQNKGQTMSKKRIANQLGLSPAVITKLCSEMLEEGLILERDPIKSSKVGRKEVQITINPQYSCCIGIIINHIKTTILLTDMDLNIIEERKMATLPEPQQHIENIINSLSEIITCHHLLRTQLLGIGISIKGYTDGVYSIHGIWEAPIDVKTPIQEALNLPVVMDNGVRCSAMLEQFTTPYDNFIFIKYMEPGIGGAVIKHGKVMAGESHSILDFGHLIIDPSQDYCPICKRRGCLESLISIEKILEQVKAGFSQQNYPDLWGLCGGDADSITIPRIINAVESGSIPLNQLFERNATYLAVCLINLQALWDIPKIIMIGDLFLSERFVNYLKMAILRYQLTPLIDRIEFQHHENDELAAIVLALNHFLLS